MDNLTIQPQSQPVSHLAEKQAGFPYTALDIYLPKLIRAGHRIVIADLI